MNKRAVGGRLLPYEPGSSPYEEDEFRGLRRRPWMCFRVGASTNEITTERFIHFVKQLHHQMIESGVLLDSETEHLKYTIVGTDYELWYKELKDGLAESKYKYDDGPLSHPIVITVLDQYDHEQVEKVIQHFAPDMYFVKVERDDVLEMLLETENEGLTALCSDFAKYLIEMEDLVETIAIKAPVEERGPTFGVVYYPPLASESSNFTKHRRDFRQVARRQMDRKSSYVKPPPGLAPPGLELSPQRSISEIVKVPLEPPPGLEAHRSHHYVSSSQSEQVIKGRYVVEPPPGISLSRPPGIEHFPQKADHYPSQPTLPVSTSTRHPAEYSDDIEFFDDGEEELKEPEVSGSHILSYQDVMCAREHMQDDPERAVPNKNNTSMMVIYIDGKKIHERFSQPFISLAHNLDLLYVVNFSISTKNKEAHLACKQLLHEAFGRGFPVKLKKRFLDRHFNQGEWSEEAAEMLIELLMFYFYTARFKRLILRLDSFIPSWDDIVESFSKVQKPELNIVGVTMKEIGNLDAIVEKIRRQIARVLGEAEAERPNTRLEKQQGYLPHNDTTVMSIANGTRHDGHNESYAQEEQSRLASRSESTSHIQYDRGYREGSQHHHEDGYRVEERLPATRSDDLLSNRYQFRDDHQQYRERVPPAPHSDSSRRSDDLHRNREDLEQEYYSREYHERGRDEVDAVMPNGQQERQELQFRERNDGASGFQGGEGIIHGDQSFVETVFQAKQEMNEEEEEPLGPIVNTDERPKQAYKFAQNEYEYEPLWKKFEGTKPPEDFRTLTAIPTLYDYMNTEVEPYLRRIQESGVYTSADHYLDVQFRLLREDLVSSLRDGIDLYRKTGTSKGNRIEGVECSDVAIYFIEKIEGKQVTERDGYEMRVAYPRASEVYRMMDNDKEGREQGLAILSCDRFVDDYHLVIISTSLLSRDEPSLHLAILEETCPFKPNTGYQMAQAKSFLPAYQFVLENMKKINPFKPIPFERYLVHGKKTIFRPSFHRHQKCEEQLAEEKRLEKIYGEIRSVAVSKRIMKGKAIPGGIDDDDDADFSYNHKRDKSEENDEEYEMLQEPMFRQHMGVNNGGSDKIMIDNKWYSISRLLDDFNSDSLDESQRVAFCHTFRSELSLIQGPPGTGKTHIGVKILKTMLQNRSHWRMTEPILIVCYTNSGLDNLLERVWQMIDDDEVLSKDYGKPRMIRYGRKCESEFLRRKNVMRANVNDDYRQKVPEKVQREQARASIHKRKKGEMLATTSATLYCSRKHLVSFTAICAVMDIGHQEEIRQFAENHVDSKERRLGLDEAFACWLLDKDFGTATKAQAKKNKASKFKNLPEDSDDERLPCNFTIENSDDEDEDDLTDEQILDKLFKKMNMECSGKDVLGATGGEADEYLSDKKWVIVSDQQVHLVSLMGRKDKDGAPVDEHITSLLKEVMPKILDSTALKKEELSDIRYIFSLARPKRWSLYQTWCAALRKLMAENLPKQICEYRMACKEAQKGFEKIDAEIMKMAMIIGATTSGCSRLRPILEQAKPRILMVEEAAEVLEGHIVSAMISSIEQVVMIGDHKQLRPMPAVHVLGTDYGLNISMFERLVERGLPYSQLRYQHRMNTTITDLIVRPAFYDNVNDASNVFSYPDVEGMASNLFFWGHRVKEETPDGISWLNTYEVDMIAALVRYLLKQSYTYKDIVVLATYAAQRNYMCREYGALFGPTEHQLVPVETVDSFQGRESKIAIVSLVRSHRGCNEHTGIGFLAVANRICVALTRAQHGMYIIGNGAYLQMQSQLWSKIVSQLNRKDLAGYNLPLKCVAHQRITLITQPQEFTTLAPEGGCSEVCNIKKDCGHLCDRKCHPNVVVEHLRPCEYKCMKTCSNPTYHHECTKRCYEDCGSCMFFVELDLQCGHKISTPCSRIQVAKCDQKCSRQLPCGHTCTNDCGAPCTDVCQNTAHTELDCGHVKEVKCGLLRLGQFDPTCVEKCSNKMLLCDHYCTERCGEQCTLVCQELITVTLSCSHAQTVICSDVGPENNTAHIQCQTLVPMNLQPCNHYDDVLCGSEPMTEICKQPCPEVLPDCQHKCGDNCGTCFKTGKHVCQVNCNKVLDCGHPCRAKCGEVCPPCKAYCSNSCEHQGCGIGSKGYGRECYKICALCTETCSNHCAHRSCSKMCFEECDVKICNEPCLEKLKCGHACLGMCGEKCPKICGTCERDKYLQCVSELSGNTQKIHRLIMNPKCYHMYPVEYLDEHVKKQREINKRLSCPKCESQIVGVLRYAKYVKKFILDANVKKVKAVVKKIDFQELIEKITNRMSIDIVTLKHLKMNLSNEFQKILKRFDEGRMAVYDAIRAVAGKAEHKWRLAFYVDVALIFQEAVRLIESGCACRIVKRKDVPPTLDIMFGRTFGEHSFPKMMVELNEMLVHFERKWKADMAGAVIPKLRLQVGKMAVLNELTTLCFQLKLENRDISEVQAKAIATACFPLFHSSGTQNVDECIAPVEKVLHVIAPKIAQNGSFMPWKKLDIPKF